MTEDASRTTFSDDTGSEESDIERLRRENAEPRDQLAGVPAAGGAVRIELLAALLDDAPIGVALLDRELRYLHVNQTLATMNEIPVEQHVGRSLTELFPRHAAHHGATMRRVLDTGEPVRGIEVSGEVLGHRSYRRHFMIDFYPVHGRHGEIIGIGVAVVDVTERKQAENVARALADASRLFAEASLDIRTALDLVARELAETLGDCCLIWLLDEPSGTRFIAAMHHTDPAALAMLHALTDGAPGEPADSWKLRSGRPEFFRVVPAETLRERVWWRHWPYLERYTIHSLIAIPLVVRGRMIGAIRLTRETTPRPYSETDYAFALDLADRAALAIDNAGLYAAEHAAREAAERAEAHSRAVFESAADAILLIDHEGRYVDANPAAEQLFGYTRDELLALHVAGDASEGAALARARFDHLRERGNWSGDGEIRRKDGTLVPVEGRSSAVSHDLFMTSLRDVSERRALERLQQEFISMVTHELRIPLTSIRGFAQLMQRRATYSENGTRAILAQADRLERLVNDLLDTARLEAGRLEIQRAPVDLVALTAASVDAIRIANREHRVTLVAEASELMGMWDGGRLAQVLENLLSNAVKYSATGSEVRVRVAVAGDRAIVSVSDEGSGIAPQDIAQLFSRFARLRGAVDSDTPGLGLGLYIARLLVEAHGGTIGVESIPGQGSTFTVALPVEHGAGDG